MKAAVLALEDVQGRRYGGTLRTRAVVHALRELGYDVTVAAPASNAAPGIRFARTPLGRLKRHFLPMPTMAGAKSKTLSRALSEGQHFDIIVCQVFQHAQYLRRGGSRALRWLDFSDLHSEFGLRESKERRGVARLSARMQALMIARQERTYAEAANIVTAAGYGDTQILRRHQVATTWLPTPVTGEVLPRPGADRLRVGFFGNFDYWPNVNAYDLITGTWLPSWMHQVTLVVAGYGSERLRPMADVELLGSVSAVADFYMQTDIVVAPVNRGSGIKVKVAEALMHGRPVIATPAALDGFPPEVRRLCRTVDLGQTPSVALLREVATETPDQRELTVLQQESFDKQVAQLIGERLSDGDSTPYG